MVLRADTAADTKPAFKRVNNNRIMYYSAQEVSHCNSFAGHHNLDRHGYVKRNTELVATLKLMLGTLVTTVSPLNHYVSGRLFGETLFKLFNAYIHTNVSTKTLLITQVHGSTNNEENLVYGLITMLCMCQLQICFVK